MIFLIEHPVTASLVLCAVINILFFIIAFSFKTDKVTDLSYSLSFIILAPLLLLSRGWDFSLEQLLVVGAIFLWGVRLGSYLLYRIILTKKDERFDDKRDNPIRLIIFWILQILAVWIIMLPYTFYLTSRWVHGFTTWSIIGFSLFITGFIIESVSDYQKFIFKSNPENSGRWIDSGLWSYSRHPNYFGEITLWWGLFIVAFPNLDGFQLFSFSGPMFITMLLLFVSGIPLLEKSAEKKYGLDNSYISYRNTTSLLIPLPRKKQ